jgi:hypothetical protein
MNVVRIASVVEGDGEVKALPILLRRIIEVVDPSVAVYVPQGFRHPSGSIRRVGGVERAVDAVARIYRNHSILILIDSDDDCPKTLGSSLYHRARTARPDLDISVVIANREYEAWYLSAAESLAGKRNLRADLVSPPDPESIRNAKGWLSKNTVSGTIYSPTQDQAALSQLFDLELAQCRSRSFRKLWKETKGMVKRSIEARLSD